MGLKVYASQADLREEFGDCSVERSPDFVVQQVIKERAVLDNKWWDMKVFMLVAHSEPWMVGVDCFGFCVCIDVQLCLIYTHNYVL